jgi:glycosyltransferase involved in cell wall biosynthesis
MNKGISVILCCYNSFSRLKPTLEHIARQEVSKDILWEVIVIDNNSDDGTAKYAEKIWKKLDCNVPFRIVFESQSGLSFAREKGINMAQYEYILFCDDDNWLANDYINKGYHVLNQNDSIGALGGKGKEISTITFPNWFDSLKTYYAVGEQHSKNGNIPILNSLYGAGLFIRKSLFEQLIKLGFSFLSTGRKSGNLSSGEDYELCLSIRLLGYKLWYDERLRFQHFITPNRLTWKYFQSLRKNIAYSSINIMPYFHEISNKPATLFWYILRFFKIITINIILIFVFSFQNSNKSVFLFYQVLSEIKFPLKVYHLRKEISKWGMKIS